MLASLGLVIVYASGGDAQLEGILLGLALGGLGVGFAIWGAVLLAADDETEERPPLRSSDEQVEEAEDVVKDEPVSRRSALVKLLVGAGGALAGALAIPSLSLGPRPGQSLFHTDWTPGARLVDLDNQPIRPGDLIPDSVTTVFPEGAAGSADAQTLLLKIDEGLLPSTGERADWSPEGCIGFSKICTHAGCPVGLYRAQSHELLCPCHQSTFDVLNEAEPTFGPADRPLPQLPIEVDEDGYLVARGDFSAPVGPGFWNVTSGGD
jgi:ubiquinol-cytochrome c reductase iron-sulfur subunit